MSLIFVLGNIGGALASAVLPAAIGGGTAGAGAAALGGAGAALGGAGAAGTAATTSAGLFGGTSLAGLAGAPTGIAATGAEIAKDAAAITATNADKAALASQAATDIAQGTSAATPATAAPVTPGAGTLTGSQIGDTIAATAVTGGGQQAVQAKQQADVTQAQNEGYQQLAGQKAEELQKTKTQQENTLGGGRSLAGGGPVHLDSGSFVIPADIVSDIGNGDTQAGMAFLKQFFETGGNA